MIKSFIFIEVLFLTGLFCQSQSAQTAGNSDVNKMDSASKSDELIESFSDDKKVGVPRRNKIEIFNYKKTNGNIAVIKFYALGENKKWKLKQKFQFEKDDLIGCDPEIKDFNNDGFKDVTYVSDVAGRGANEVRKLFVYDKKKDALIYIKNSEDYPNLLYNKTLNCLDSFMVHGTSTTLFLKIAGDKFNEFAGVGNDGFKRTAYLIGKNGKEKVLRKDKINEDEIYIRYRTFNPPRAYTAKELKQ